MTMQSTLEKANPAFGCRQPTTRRFATTRRFGRVSRMLAAAISMASCLGLATATPTKTPLVNPKAYVSRFIVDINTEDRAEPLKTLERIAGSHGATCIPFKKVQNLIRIECYGPSRTAAKEKADRAWKAMKEAEEVRMADEVAALGQKPGKDAPEAVRLEDAQKRLQATQSQYDIHQYPSLKDTEINAEQDAPGQPATRPLLK
ncbi:MAG: hypothetical protein NTW21_31080 [Verrucomicrobia bacterium]|nr:hypothetical protein [Verrucomicrobiota bacterium]